MASHPLEQAFQTAYGHHQAGRLAAAQEIYRRIVAEFPDHADALHLLGVVAYQQGRLGEATTLIGRAVALNPTIALYHCNLGESYRKAGQEELALASLQRAVAMAPELAEAHNSLGIMRKAAGQFAEAIAAYRQAIACKPGYAEAHNNLGAALHAANQPEEALAALERAIALAPGYAEARNNRAVVLHALRRLDEALASCRQAISLRPGYAGAHNTLGTVLLDMGPSDEAIAAFERALELDPNLAGVHANLGSALRTAGRLDEAAAAYRRAIALRPGFAEALNNLGVILKETGQSDEAIAAFRRAIVLLSEAPDAHANLGAVLYQTGQVDEAVAACRRAAELRGDDPRISINLGNALLAQGEWTQAVAAYQRALASQPASAAAHSNLLMASQYQGGVTLASLSAAHAGWDEQHAAPLAACARSWDLDRDPDRPLRLGFVSPDLRRHPVGHFLVRVLEELGQSDCAVVCYQTRALRDELTQRLAAAASRWHNVASLDDQALAARIREDRIDILFDLSGHTSDNRLLTFARRPAPIQITWIGYVGTTGLSTMDYLLADRYHVPEGAEVHYREVVLRMPDGYVCYDPPAQAPRVGPLPALERGEFTFGSFNNAAKLTPAVIALWAEIVRRVPGSRLLLATPALGGATARQRITDTFEAAGADRRRLEFRGKMRWHDMLAAYNAVDLALDPFPYSGGLTTCEALWMGVPVVTSPGETFASRHAFSHLSNAGLTETIASGFEDYADLAVRLAGDLDLLREIRAGLRDKMAHSPLCDGPRFAAHFVPLLRGAWRRWCGVGTGGLFSGLRSPPADVS